MNKRLVFVPGMVVLLAAALSAIGVSAAANPHSLSALMAIMVLLTIGVLARLKRPEDRTARRFFWLTVCIAGYLAGVYGTFVFPVGRVLDAWCLVGVLFFFCLPVAALAFALSLANTRTRLSRTVFFLSVLSAVAFSTMRLVGFFPMEFYDAGIRRSMLATPAYVAANVQIQLFAWYGIFEIYRSYRRLPPGLERHRLKWFLLSTCAANVFAYGNFFASLGLASYPLSAVAIAAYSSFVAYLIVRHRFLDVEVVVRKAVTYATYTVLVTLSYAGIVIVLSVAIDPPIHQTSHVQHGLAILLAVFLLTPLRSRVQEVVDRRFFRDRYDRRRVIQELADGLASIMDLRELQKAVLETLVQAMRVESATLYLAQDGNEPGSLQLTARKAFDKQVEPVDAEDGQEVFQISAESVQAMREAGRAPMLLQENGASGIGAEGLPDEVKRFASAGGYALVLPVATSEKLVGLILMGRKLSELPWTSEDLYLLRMAGSEACVAFDNARNYETVLVMKRYADSILRSLETGLAAIGTDGRITSANRAFDALMGTGFHRAEGRHYEDVFRRACPLAEAVARALEGACVTAKETVVADNVLSVTTAPLVGTKGAPAGVVLTLSDITEKKRLEKQAESRERLALLGEMAAYVSHEIKNPITSMQLLAKALPGRLDDRGFLSTFAEVMSAEIPHLNRIVRDLLDFARPSRLTWAEVDVGAATKSAVALLRPELERRGVTISEAYEPDGHPILGDGDRLKEVLVNLIKNAADAVDGSTEKRVSVRVFGGDSRVSVSISDNGIGLTEDEKQKVFKPFFSAKPGGTGLGLAICSKVVAEHAGRIDVESRPAEGSVFTVSIPRADCTAQRDVHMHNCLGASE